MEEKHGKELKLKQDREQKHANERSKQDSEAVRLSKMKTAATIIQAAWRGFSLRKALKGGTGKGKGGKGKGKKK